MNVHKQEFIWGVASSAPQSEGAAFVDGKGPSIWDIFAAKKRKISGGHTPENSCSFYHRFEDDLSIVNNLGIPHFRFSVSWPRILPDGKGRANSKGLDFYDRLIDTCLEKKITPWITQYHWDLPHKLEEAGGWTNRDIINWYSDYSKIILSKYSDRVKHWMVLNEPLVFTGAGYFLGVHAPGRKGMDNFLAATHHAALTQATGIRIIKDHHSSLQAGSTYSCSPISAYSTSPKDKAAAHRVDALLNRLFIEPLLGYGYPTNDLPFLQKMERYIKSEDAALLKAIPDFIGIQNYTREVVKHSWFTPYISAKLIDAKSRKVKHTMLNWEIYPEGIYEMVKKYQAYPEIKSIIITENGAAYNDRLFENLVYDEERTNFLKSYIEQVKRARTDFPKLNGYFVWSLTDNFEWAEGYYPRFGLIHIDYNSQKRIIKNSGQWYSNMIRKDLNITKETDPSSPKFISV